MRYEISPKNNVNHGTMLSVRIPVVDVDWTALYTLEEDRPDFIVPFRYHHMDDEIELTFLPENRRMLRYFGGERSSAEYSALFTNLMIPLQSCSDWFLQPFCFVLDFDWIFYDSATQAISYLYFPVKEECASVNEIVEMIRQVNNSFRVDNQKLENKVLRTITNNNFRISEFMGIFKDNQPHKDIDTQPAINIQKVQPKKEAEVDDGIQRKPVVENSIDVEKPSKRVIISSRDVLTNDDPDDELFINLSDESQKSKKDKKKKQDIEPGQKGLFSKIFGKKEEKREKQTPKKGEETPEDTSSRSVISGAVEEMVKVSREKTVPPMQPQFQRDSETVLVPQNPCAASSARLVYRGNGNFPAMIEIDMRQKRMFSIGRFDSILNRKQSDFEFPADTAEVSRRHAVIEIINDEYYLVDIGSLAGTFVNNTQIELNKHVLLNNGDEVSFGEAGADYVFKK